MARGGKRENRSAALDYYVLICRGDEKTKGTPPTLAPLSPPCARIIPVVKVLTHSVISSAGVV